MQILTVTLIAPREDSMWVHDVARSEHFRRCLVLIGIFDHGITVNGKPTDYTTELPYKDDRLCSWKVSGYSFRFN